MDAEASGIVAEIIQRHHASQGPDSRALVSVVEAIRDVIQAQGMTVTPVSLFAAATASLTTATSDADMQASAGSQPPVHKMCSAGTCSLSHTHHLVFTHSCEIVADGDGAVYIHVDHTGTFAHKVLVLTIWVSDLIVMRCHRAAQR